MFRTIVRNPGSYVIAAITTATGIGAVVAMFSVYDALVLNPMDVVRPQELVAIRTVNPRVEGVPASLSWTRFDQSLRHAQSFSHVAAWDFDSASLKLGDQAPEELSVLRVSSDFFGTLGTAPLQGRLFTHADDQPNAPPVCVMSYELWRARFRSQPILGELIPLNGTPTEVVGILRPRFTAPWTDQQLFLPRLFDTSTMMPENVKTGSSFLSVVGRLRPGVTVAQAQAELDALAASYSARFAGHMDAANSTSVQLLLESVVSANRERLILLLAAVGAVLLVGCGNASTLFLGRLLARGRDTAVRQALGATRARLVGEFLLESLALSLLAGLIGLAVAWALLRGGTVLLGPTLGQGSSVGLSTNAFALALVVVLLTALVVGLVPALYVTRRTMAPLVAFARCESTTVSGRRLRALLVVGEVAFSSVLLIGAALLLVSLSQLQRSNPGFDPDRTAAGSVNLPLDRYGTPERQAAFVALVLERLEAAPGVERAAAVFGLPLGAGFAAHQYVVDGRPIPPPSHRARAGIRLVTEHYFDVMGIRLKEGRTFTLHDRQGGRLVCLVNESMARRVFGGEAVGKVIRRGRDAGLAYEVVGVVEDVLSYGLRRPAVDEVFYPLRQLPWPQFTLVARSDGDPALLRQTFERAVAEVDMTQPVAQFTTMAERLDASFGSEKAMAAVTTAFAAVALLMALVGLYAVLAQSVASRTAEIAVRVALGADRVRIVRLILGNGLAIVGAGIGAGVIGAAVGGRYLASQLYSVDPRDPWIFGSVAASFALAATLACLIPSWRAAGVDPVSALRRV